MSQVIIAGDTSGTITLQAPAVSGSTTLTLPAATGTVMVSGNMPAFSASANTSQTISSGTHVKLTIFGTKNFDTNNNFSSNRFTPTVAGYYQINCSFGSNDGIGTTLQAEIWKNGATYLIGGYSATGGAYYNCGISTILYLNGSTDYVEFYGYSLATSSVGGNACMFAGCLVRTA